METLYTTKYRMHWLLYRAQTCQKLQKIPQMSFLGIRNFCKKARKPKSRLITTTMYFLERKINISPLWSKFYGKASADSKKILKLINYAEIKWKLHFLLFKFLLQDFHKVKNFQNILKSAEIKICPLCFVVLMLKNFHRAFKVLRMAFAPFATFLQVWAVYRVYSTLYTVNCKGRRSKNKAAWNFEIVSIQYL